MYHQDLECYIKKFRVDLQEAVFDKEAVREEHGTQKLKVAQLEEQNRETSRIRQELKDSRTMVYAKYVETQKFGTQLQNNKGRHERLPSIEMIWQKNWRKTSMIGRSHWRHEQDLKSLATLTFRRPNPCYIPMLDATFVSCHLFDVFPTATIKSVFSKLLYVLCASLSISLISPHNPWTQ